MVERRVSIPVGAIDGTLLLWSYLLPVFVSIPVGAIDGCYILK